MCLQARALTILSLLLPALLLLASPALASTAPTGGAAITVSATVEARCLLNVAPLDPARVTAAAALRAVSLSCAGIQPTVTAVAGLADGLAASNSPVAVIVTY